MRMIVVGAGGRMGRMLVRTIAETDGASLAAAVEQPGSPSLGRDAGVLAGLPAIGVPVLDDARAAFAKGDVVIDFTIPAATEAFARLAAEAGIAHVVGTTGLGPAEDQAIREAAQKIAIVRSGNMSLGVNLLAGLVRRAARALAPDWDIEIVEMHHRMKIDAPSGTAILLGEAAAEGRDATLDQLRTPAREGHTGARKAGAIGFAALRGGTVVGDHDVILAGAGERILLGHRAEDRGIFARGAVKAALWLKGRNTPGLYSMADVLGLGA